MASSLAEIQVFRTYPCVFDAVTLPHVSEVTPEGKAEDFVFHASGSLDPNFVAQVKEEPQASIKTPDIRSVLSGVSLLTGLSVATLAKLQYQRQTVGSLNGISGGTGFRLDSTKGLLLVDEISAEQDDREAAQVMLTYHALLDAANGKVFNGVVDANITGSVSFPGAYRNGPVLLTIAATEAQVVGATSISVKTGIEIERVPVDGDHAARVIYIIKREPSIEIEGNNLHLSNGTNAFSMQALDAATVYLRRVFAGGRSYPDDEAEHVSLSLASGGGVTVQSIPVRNKNKATQRYKITGKGQLTVGVDVEIVYPS